MALPRQSPPFECSASINLQSVAFLTQLTALVPAVIYVFNHQTMSNEYANRSVGEMLGYGPDEIKAMGENLLPTIVHPEDFDQLAVHVGSLQNLAAGEHAVWEYRAVRADGREVWLRSIDAVFSRSADGSVLRHVGVAFDITAEKQVEQELRDRQQLADGTLKELDELMDAAEASDAPAAGDNIHEMIARIRTRLRDQLQQSQASITAKATGSKPDALPHQLEAVLQALISDAFTYHAPQNGAVVTVECTAQDTATAVRLQSSGFGQPPTAVMPANGAASVEGASGQYVLSRLSRLVVENLGGSLTIENVQGDDRVITLTVPRTKRQRNA